MSRPVKRPYDSTRRTEMAEATRRHVIDVARPLFIDQGYEATSMRQLAESAGVSLQTLYNAFGSKFGIFSALIDVVVAGDHEPVALADRHEHLSAEATEDPGDLVAAAVSVAVSVLERLAPIFPTMRAAAASDPLVADAYQRFTLDARHKDMAVFGRRLDEMGALRGHLDAGRATDVLWTVLSPDVHDLLVAHRGWSIEEFTVWATDTLTHDLLARSGLSEV